ncbi:MAG: ABC transporter ATP-binding protein [Actinobacteria bacterium]|nr:ABC transporter ATP-binding protein [Actinomycetota bacterium]
MTASHPHSNSEPVLRLHGVRKKYGGRTVVDVADLALGAHPIEGLIGPNGAGKTTLMKLVTRAIPASEGQIMYHPPAGEGGSRDLARMAQDAIARAGVLKSNQLIQDFDSLTIRESLLLALASSGRERFYRLFGEKAFRRGAQGAIDEYLDYFHFRDPDAHAGSAGEKKLLDIVRCLLLRPKFLLLDEPTAGLPQEDTDRVMELMRRKTTAGEFSLLIIEHDLDLIWGSCTHVHFMADGHVVLQGSPEEVRANNMLAEKYLGGSHA